MRSNPLISLTLLAAALVVAPVARAQFDEDDSGSVGVQMGGTGVPGMNIQIDVNEGRGRKRGSGTTVVETKTSRREEISSDKPGESFKLVYEEDPSGRTGFKFLEPEHFNVRVTEGTSMFPALNDSIPASAEVKAGKFYVVQVSGPGGRVVFEKKFEGRQGMLGTFWIRPGQGSANVNVTFTTQEPAPPPAAAPKASCMGGSDFAAVKEAVEGESFSAEKVGVLGSAISDRWICVNQVIEVLELYPFSTDKIAALRLMKPAISDPQNRFKIYSALTFASDKDEAKKILEPR